MRKGGGEDEREGDEINDARHLAKHLAEQTAIYQRMRMR
jgi:hypothetical protein